MTKRLLFGPFALLIDPLTEGAGRTQDAFFCLFLAPLTVPSETHCPGMTFALYMHMVPQEIRQE
jgi:hypothetical protein